MGFDDARVHAAGQEFAHGGIFAEADGAGVCGGGIGATQARQQMRGERPSGLIVGDISRRDGLKQRPAVLRT
jgi:hypothetical protein